MENTAHTEAVHYTYADFLAWDEYQRYEIIDGEALQGFSCAVCGTALSALGQPR